MIMEMETLLSIPDSEMENETESSNSKSTFSFDVGGNAEADDHEKEGSSSPKKEESTFLAPRYTWTDLKKTAQKQEKAEAIGNICNDLSSERFLHCLRRCYVKIPKPCYTFFHPPSARRISSRKTPSQRRREQEMVMESLLSIPEEEGLEVVEIPRKGRGVKARIPFKEGDFVCEYIGEFMSGETGRYMEKEHDRDQSGSYLYFFWYRSDEYCIDATSESSKMGRLINHSRLKANLEPKVWEVRPGEPRLILQASKRIEAGEEILYDYGESRGKVVEDLDWLKY